MAGERRSATRPVEPLRAASPTVSSPRTRRRPSSASRRPGRPEELPRERAETEGGADDAGQLGQARDVHRPAVGERDPEHERSWFSVSAGRSTPGMNTAAPIRPFLRATRRMSSRRPPGAAPAAARPARTRRRRAARASASAISFTGSPRPGVERGRCWCRARRAGSRPRSGRRSAHVRPRPGAGRRRPASPIQTSADRALGAARLADRERPRRPRGAPSRAGAPARARRRRRAAGGPPPAGALAGERRAPRKTRFGPISGSGLTADGGRRARGSPAGSPIPSEVADHRRSADGDERERDAGDRRDPDRHADVHEHLEEEREHDPRGDDRAEQVARARDDLEPAPDDEQVEQQQDRGAEETALLGERGEGEVGRVLGQVVERASGSRRRRRGRGGRPRRQRSSTASGCTRSGCRVVRRVRNPVRRAVWYGFSTLTPAAPAATRARPAHRSARPCRSAPGAASGRPRRRGRPRARRV